MSSTGQKSQSPPLAELLTQLRRLREAAGKERSDVPKWCCTEKWLGKIEDGLVQRVQPGLVLKICGWLEVDQEQTRELKALAIATLEDQWWDAFRPGMDDSLRLFLRRQESASRLQFHSWVFVPALLQHETYIDAIYAPIVRWPEGNKIDPASAKRLRLELQERWMSSQRPMDVVIGEAAFALNLGQGVIDSQLRYLCELSERPGFNIRVATFNAGRYDVIGAEFDILLYDDKQVETVIFARDGQTSRWVPPNTYGGKYFIDGFHQSMELSTPIRKFRNVSH